VGGGRRSIKEKPKSFMKGIEGRRGSFGGGSARGGGLDRHRPNGFRVGIA